ncbi:Protein KRI1 homolog [Eumeta japonica]|uniref:Protein KRI1 homolog n=1 Tax=Eumeta variegata TaxID=151549 RepID=A0A4C1TB46_EUMVA|nr:Protein KRI1 homolog [Eumeta japonica]
MLKLTIIASRRLKKRIEVSESDSDESDSSEEDEILDPLFDQDFLKTLASLKNSDEDDNDEVPTVQRSLSPSMVEEERRLKAEFVKVMNDDNDSE